MVERYFEGINFTSPIRTDSPRLIHLAKTMPKTTGIIEVPTIGSVGEVKVIESQPNWNFEDLLVSYVSVLGSIEAYLNMPLSTDDRIIILVTPAEIIPTNDEEKRQLVEMYGSYVLDGIAGDCTRLGKGFRIRIGYKGLENITPVNRVLEVLAHECGHTLGKRIDSPVFEELKAYAFQALFMGLYLNAEYLMHGISPDQVHEIAKHRLGLLTTLGINEGKIISHLTGEPFGPFQPQDYLKLQEAIFEARPR